MQTKPLSRQSKAAATGVKYIERDYDGISSASDMATVNTATEKQIKKFLQLNKPIRILQDLRGSFATSFEIYEEAIKILNMYEIDKIAIVQPRDKFIAALADNTRDTYQKFINFRIFTDAEQAKMWLNEA